MSFKKCLILSLVLLSLVSLARITDASQPISVKVINKQGAPVEGAQVTARYLKIVHQDGVDYPVPMELAKPQKTDKQGRCQLNLQDVAWSLAALSAHRTELTTDEAIELSDKAPSAPQEREVFNRELSDRCQRFATAYQLLAQNRDRDTVVTLELSDAIRVSGRVRVNGTPLAKAFVTISSPKSEVDQLYPRSAPELTDRDGRFSFYAIPGALNRARIVAERASGDRVLNLSEVSGKRTARGFVYDFDTDAKTS